MAYAPKRRSYTIRWRLVLPLLLLLCLIVYAIFGFFFTKKAEARKKFTICDFSEKKTFEKLNKKTAETYPVKDYLYYGESLGIYEKVYHAKQSDPLAGKTIELYNLCNDQSISMTFGNTADQKIALEEILPGFYELFVVDNLVRKRVVFQDTVESEPFYTAQRKGSIHKVSVTARKNLLEEYGERWDKAYMFLHVEKATPIAGDIDVYLDPYGMNVDNQLVPDEGVKGNGVLEYKETYEAALLMKKTLEAYGLRVLISKKSAEEKPAYMYGEDGRLAQAYNKHAKYYVYLRLNALPSDASIKGMEVWHSAYISDAMAKKLMFGLEKTVGVKGSPYTSGTTMGIRKSPVTKDGYDLYANLRESGGRATMAGKGTPNSIKENKQFVEANGMHAVEIDFAYISNAQDAKFWKENKGKMVEEIAKNFAKAIHASK